MILNGSEWFWLWKIGSKLNQRAKSTSSAGDFKLFYRCVSPWEHCVDDRATYGEKITNKKNKFSCILLRITSELLLALCATQWRCHTLHFWPHNPPHSSGRGPGVTKRNAGLELSWTLVKTNIRTEPFYVGTYGKILALFSLQALRLTYAWLCMLRATGS